MLGVVLVLGSADERSVRAMYSRSFLVDMIVWPFDGQRIGLPCYEVYRVKSGGGTVSLWLRAVIKQAQKCFLRVVNTAQLSFSEVTGKRKQWIVEAICGERK